MEKYRSTNGAIEFELIGWDELNNGRMLYIAEIYINGIKSTSQYFNDNWNYLNFKLDQFIFESPNLRYVFIPAEGYSFVINTKTLERIFLPYKGCSTFYFYKNEFIDDILKIYYKDDVVEIGLNYFF